MTFSASPIYKEHSQCVYGFVEGKDDPAFYKYLIKSQLPDDWEIKLITSGNKQKVIRSYKNFNWTDYSRKRICFFIDRDLQDFLEVPQKLDDNLYITDGYSIENSILHDELIFEVLSDIYQITQLRAEEEDIIKQIIRTNKDLFFESIMPLMGQILLWRRSGSKPNLNNLALDKFFSFSQANLVSIDCNKILEVAAKQLGCNLCADIDISTAENEIRSHINARNCVRGKYAFWLFVKQCESIWEAIPILLQRFPNKPSKRIQ